MQRKKYPHLRPRRHFLAPHRCLATGNLNLTRTESQILLSLRVSYAFIYARPKHARSSLVEIQELIKHNPDPQTAWQDAIHRSRLHSVDQKLVEICDRLEKVFVDPTFRIGSFHCSRVGTAQRIGKIYTPHRRWRRVIGT